MTPKHSIGRTFASPFRRLTGPVMFCLVALLAQAGCGTASTSSGRWAYMGSDNSLRSPPLVMDKSLSPEQATTLNRAAFEAWKTRVAQAQQSDIARCSTETGEPAKPSILFGYGDAFEACMRRLGWLRGSNPL